MNEPVELSADRVRILLLSGPSGSGKSTIVDRLIELAPVRLMKAVSATTRPARPGEVNGEDYYFLSSEEFEARRRAGDFIESAEVHGSGNWYGTLRSELQRARDAGAWAFLEIDVQGARTIMAEYPEALSIFLRTSSQAEYERRLLARGSETDEAIRRRLETARDELQYAAEYRYQVINDDLDRATREICEILKSWEEQSVV